MSLSRLVRSSKGEAGLAGMTGRRCQRSSVLILKGPKFWQEGTQKKMKAMVRKRVGCTTMDVNMDENNNKEELSSIPSAVSSSAG